MTKPSLFLAFAERAERDVTGLIGKILKDEYSEKVNLINGKNMDQPGNINQHPVEAIGSCR